MKVTDFDHPALVVIDLQVGIKKLAKLAAPNSLKEILSNNSELIKIFINHNLPVILVTVEPKILPRTLRKRFAQIVPELTEFLESAKVKHFIKHAPSAFSEHDFEHLLHELSVKTLVMTGISTNNGVAKTARDGVQRDFNVIYVENAMTGMNAKAHIELVNGEFTKIGKVIKSESILYGNNN
jgi:nicotinamidase-related amidase